MTELLVAVGEYRRYQLREPESIESLVGAGYLNEVPLNPFTGQPMRNVRIGSGDCAGNFTYLVGREVYYKDGVVRADRMTGYLLLGYGLPGSYNRSYLAGHVDDCLVALSDCIIFWGGTMAESIPKFGDPGVTMWKEPLNDVLHDYGYQAEPSSTAEGGSGQPR